MKKIIIIILFIIGILFFLLRDTKEVAETKRILDMDQLAAGSYTVDPAQSHVSWKGNMGKIKSHYGEVAIISGELEINQDDQQGNIIVDMNSISSEVGDDLNNHLKSPDFFDAQGYPTASLKITSIADGVIVGDLTVRGVTEAIETPFELIETPEGVRLIEGELMMDRSRFNVRFGSSRFFSDLGDKVIDDIIPIHYSIYLRELNEHGVE